MIHLSSATETAVVVQVPEAEPTVAEHRLRFDVAASWGVGAHVSVLYPFVSPAEFDEDALRRLSAAVSQVDAFDDVVPHLTVGERNRGSLQELRDVERTVSRSLPISTYVDRVALIAGRPDADSWHTVQQFPLRTG